MRILHASHANLKHLGARNYLLPVRINNGFIRNSHEVFWFSDRDVARCSSLLGTRKFGGIGATNRKFLEVCKNFAPEVIALGTVDLLTQDTIAQARRFLPNTAIFQYYIDPLFIQSNYANVRAKVDVVDITFVTTGGSILKSISGKGSKTAFVPNPVDLSIDRHRCHEQLDLDYDVFFSGSSPGKSHPSDLRSHAYQLIQQHLPETRCSFWGKGFGKPLWGANFMEELARAKIGLNFSRYVTASSTGPGSAVYLYSSDRIALYQGNGLLVFVPKIFDLRELYGEDSIIEIAGEDDFIEKLGFYLHNDTLRRTIAQNGYELAHREFNERLVSQYMIESALGVPYSHQYRWPTDRY